MENLKYAVEGILFAAGEAVKTAKLAVVLEKSVEEIDALVEELLTLDNPYNCPHGRPTIISMTKYEIEKKFKRIV